MTKADKRARQKENARLAKEQREAELRNEKRKKTILRVGIAAALFAAVVGLFAWLSSGDDDDATATTETTAPTTDTTETTGPTTDTTALPAFTKTECTDTAPEPAPDPKTFDTAPEQTIDPAKTYTATITTSCGTITAELDAKDAPVATNNFVFLANEGFYDGLTWHRVVPNFVVQGGDPKGDGSGGPGYDVAGEVPTDNYPLGSLAAAKAGTDPAGTMGSQFFVVTGTNGTTLPNEYARFGIVTEGLDVARTLESFAEGDGPPSRPLYIFDIEIAES